MGKPGLPVPVGSVVELPGQSVGLDLARGLASRSLVGKLKMTGCVRAVLALERRTQPPRVEQEMISVWRRHPLDELVYWLVPVLPYPWQTKKGRTA